MNKTTSAFLALAFLLLYSSGLFGQLLVLDSIRPHSMSATAPANSNVEAFYWDVIDPLDFNTDSIRLQGLYSGYRLQATGSTVTGVGTAKVTFNPGSDFLPGEPVVLTQTPGVNDTAGNYNPYVGKQGLFYARSTGGAGNFRRKEKVPVSAGFGSAAVGDFNGDHKLDVAVAGGSNSFVIHTYTPGVGWGAALVNSTVNGQVACIRAGDIDADGDLDVVTCGSSRIEISKNNGNGTFQAPLSITANNVQNIALLDWEGDGDLDVYGYHNVSSSAYRLYSNDGTGALSSAVNYGGVWTGPIEQIITQFSLGYLGAISSEYSGNRIISNGTSLVCPSPGGPTAVSGADIDGDHDGDVCIALADARRVLVKENNGSNVFVSLDSLDLGLGASAIATADLDGDLDIDIVAASRASDLLTIALNDGNGDFIPLGVAHPGEGPVGLHAGDFDGDGDLDLLTVNRQGLNNATYYFTLMLNDTFPSIVTAIPAPHATGVAPGANVTVQWTVPMGASAANINSFIVEGEFAGARSLPVGTAFSGTGTSAITINPVMNYAAGERVRVVATNAGFSSTGDKAEYSHAFEFVADCQPGTLGFQPATPITVSNLAISAVAADFDRDGEMDFATLGENSQSTLSIRMGEHCVGFDSRYDTPLGQTPVAMVARDFTRDGYVDIAIAFTNEVGLYVNDHTGQFVYSAEETIYNTTALAAGDFDANGYQDLAATDVQGNTYFMFNNGGSFGAYGSILYRAPNNTGMLSADMDTDGDVDLVYIASADDEVHVAMNPRSPNNAFHSIGGTAVGNEPLDLDLADFNLDGHMDVVTANRAGGSISIRYNDGLGVLSTGIELTGVPQARRVVAGDLDGDDDPDLVALLETADSFRIYLNDGLGGFNYLLSRSTTTDPWDLIMADYDGDRALDVGVVDRQSGGVQIFENSGTPLNIVMTSPVFPQYANNVGQTADLSFDFSANLAPTLPISRLMVHGEQEGLIQGTWTASAPQRLTFSPSTSYFPGEKLQISLAGCLLNSPGVSVTRPYAIEYYTATAPASGILSQKPPVTMQATNVASIAVADWDNDGVLEVAVGIENPMTSWDTIWVLENDGAGNLSISTSLRTGLGVAQISSFDADMDGDPDLGVANEYDGIWVFTSNGNGTFGQLPTVDIISGPRDFTAIDLDIDRDLDIVAAEDDNSSGNSYGNYVQFNDGSGLFQGISRPSNGTNCIVGGDFNGDYWPETVMGSQGGLLRSFRNDSAGNLELLQNVLWTHYPEDIASADLNGDGFPDVVITDEWNQEIRIFLNNGLGVLSASQAFPKYRPNNCAIGDMNGDGAMDIVVTALDSFAIIWNTGTGVFSPPDWRDIQRSTRALALADFNGDRKLDIIVGDDDIPEVVVLLNDFTNDAAQPEAALDFQIIPNPNTGNMRLLPVGWNEEETIVTLRDLTGRLVFAQTYPNGQQSMGLSLGQLSSGIYVVEMRQGDAVMRKQVAITP